MFIDAHRFSHICKDVRRLFMFDDVRLFVLHAHVYVSAYVFMHF